VNSSSLESPLTKLADLSLEVVGFTVRRVERAIEWLNHDPTGLAEAGYGPATK
jgi:hypothetical protein